VTACSGKCGRDGAGPFHSGDPGRDRRFTWCDYCWSDLMNKRMPPGLVKDLPPGTMVPFQPSPVTVPELSALGRVERKILGGEAKAAVLEDTGTLAGYLATIGNKDLQGDTIEPGALDATVADFTAGRLQWFLTDAHSEKASDTVAEVTHAVLDGRGLRIAGRWMGTETAQRLRRMVRDRTRLGLSIDYHAVKWRPDPSGGRFLSKVSVFGGAVTPKPANPLAFITAGKGMESWAPVVDVYADVQARHRDPDREQARREDAMLAAADWPPPGLFGRETALALIRGAAAAKAARLPADDGARLERERWQAANRYSADLSMWLAAHR